MYFLFNLQFFINKNKKSILIHQISQHQAKMFTLHSLNKYPVTKNRIDQNKMSILEKSEWLSKVKFGFPLFQTVEPCHGFSWTVWIISLILHALIIISIDSILLKYMHTQKNDFTTEFVIHQKLFYMYTQRKRSKIMTTKE